MIKYGFFNADNHDRGPYPVADFIGILKEFMTDGVFEYIASPYKNSNGYYDKTPYTVGFSLYAYDKFATISSARAWINDAIVGVDSSGYVILFNDDDLRDVGNIPGARKKAFVVLYVDSVNRSVEIRLIFGPLTYSGDPEDPVLGDDGIGYNKLGEITFYNEGNSYSSNFAYSILDWSRNRDYIDNPDKFFVCFNTNFMNLSGYFKQYDISMNSFLKEIIPTAIETYDEEMQDILDDDQEDLDDFISDETTEVDTWAASLSPDILTPAQVQTFTQELESIQTNYLLKSDVVTSRTELSPEDTRRVPASSLIWSIFGPVPYPDEP